MKQRQVGEIAIITPKGYLTGGDETDDLGKAIDALGEEIGRASCRERV